ncbi:MAG: FAD-dependent oxidoreductase, partial [Acidimicrobiales bacterium]|nr:FAD-dependent oxidoreductase [Acidimicrobiales bacterium]
MATEQNFDIVVIGGGPAGYAAALYAGSAGLSVALVE